jgi:photosystem II stability/assembly factor-like uncharacterized protein
MKQIFAYSLFLLSTSSLFLGTASAKSGWVRQYPPAPLQRVSFLGVSFVDAKTGFIVGGYGTILHTTDGGNTWTAQASGTTQWLRGVSATDTSTATAVGDSGTILHTTNGGAIWTQQSSGTTHSLNALCFTDQNTGTAVGDSGTLLRTSNGGATWLSQVSGTLADLNAVSFLSRDTGTVVGSSGTILHSTNGGTLWTGQNIGQYYRLLGVALTSADTAMVLGDYQGCCTLPSGANGPVILRVTSGGILWKAVPPRQLFLLCRGCLPGYLGAVSFTGGKTGAVAVGNCIFHTTTGGGVVFTDSVIAGEGSWSVQVADSNVYQGVSFTDANNGTVVGGFGIILHTTSGGVTGIKDNPTRLPSQFVLEQNYPNPFNPSTTIRYSLPSRSHVTMTVFNTLGQQVAELVNREVDPGSHDVKFDGSNIASGIYFYRIRAGSFVQTRKLVVIH